MEKARMKLQLNEFVKPVKPINGLTGFFVQMEESIRS
jgi:hypothetical protein